jgi:hypothetical protein
MTRLIVAGVLCVLAFSGPARAETRDDYCNGFNAPRRDQRTATVRNIDELERAVREARSGTAIVIAKGDYALRQSLSLSVPDVTLRGATGDPVDVVIHGRGMTGDDIGVAIAVAAPGVTIAGVTIRDVGFHAIQVRGEAGASRFTLHHARLLDTGQQLLKVSLADNGKFADDGTVACSDLSYSDHAPSDYTNGIDALGVKGWTIRNNRLSRIRGPQSGNWGSGPAILIWAASEDTIVDGNVIVDSFRGIALGLAAGTASYTRNRERAFDHRGGVIRNNVIVNLNPWADEAIEANAAIGVRIEHNTVLVTGNAPWSIGARFPMASAVLRNNLTNRPSLRRDGAAIDEAGGITNAQPNWFVDAAHADMRLTAAGAAALGAGAAGPTAISDFFGRARPSDKPTVGAIQSDPAAGVPASR